MTMTEADFRRIDQVGIERAERYLAMAEKRSMKRATYIKRKVLMLGAFIVAAFLLLAGLLQAQQSRLRDLVDQERASTQKMCESRRANAMHANSTWDQLAAIEERNTFINADIRNARLRVYRQAHLLVPICEGN